MKRLCIDYTKGMFRQYRDDKVAIYAAQSTLFILMSMIPFLMLLILFVRILNLDESVITGIIRRFAPEFLSDNVVGLFNQLFSRPLAALSISLVSVIWSAGKAFQGIQYGLNNVKKLEDNRSWFYLRFRAIINTIMILCIMVFLMIFLVYGTEIADIVAASTPSGRRPIGVTILLFIRYPLAFLLMIVFFTYIYTNLPIKKTSFQEQLPSGLACSIAWMVFTLFLALFTKWFGFFSVYGSMMMLMLSMFWLYICMIIFFVCAEIQPMLYFLVCYKMERDKHPSQIPKVAIPGEVLQVCKIGRG